MIRSLHGVGPRVHPTAFVSEFAYVIGDVEIGEGSSIWPGAVVRSASGTISIGRYTSVQDNSQVYGEGDVVIGDRVVIGHLVLCHAGKVADRVLIGSGARVAAGVEVGEDSLIASGATVDENTIVPPRSLVMGVPGRITGAVAERHTQAVKALCDSYIRKTQRYKRQGDLESRRA